MLDENFSSKVKFHAALLLTSVLFVYVFSYSTSPCYELLGGDSAIFQVVGKYWAQGYLPYVNVFDHKGPLIFFINMLGYMIAPRTGVTVLQTISLYVTSVLIWQTMSLYSASTVWKSFFFALTLIFYAAHYEEGNHVTEYSLPFLAAATYCFLRALKNSADKKFFHPTIYGFVYGVGFGACVMIRTSDSAQICCQVFLATIFLLQARDFKLLLKNFLSFCAGVTVINLPFVMYFAAHDILQDALYGTILYNIKYAQLTATHAPIETRIIYSLVHHAPFFAMVIVATIALKQKFKSRLLWSGLFIGAALAVMLIKLRLSDQYAMIFLGVAPILFAMLHEIRDVMQNIWHAQKISLKRLFVKFMIFFAAAYVGIMAFYLKAILFAEETPLSMFFTAYSKRAELLNSNEHANILKLRALIPDSEANSFVCWGNFCTGSHWILQADMKPRERFFMNNTLLMKIDPKIRKEFFGNIRQDYPLWILYGVTFNRKHEPFDSDKEFEQLLAEKYQLKGEVYIYPQTMRLYRLKD